MEEERLLKKEVELANFNAIPSSVAEFDAALIAEPNSSKLWTHYMAFYIEVQIFNLLYNTNYCLFFFKGGEIEKARRIAKRALETIAMEKVQEKFNIWIALLNLENIYGNKVCKLKKK